MTGLLNDLDSAALAVLASRTLQHGVHASPTADDIESGRLHVTTDNAAAQVYATLALVQAVRELRDAVAARSATAAIPVTGATEDRPHGGDAR